MAYATLVSNKPADPLEPITYRDMATPLGELRLVASPKGLRGAWFTDQEGLPSGGLDAVANRSHPGTGPPRA